MKKVDLILFCCFRYHKGTDFQANHNNDFYRNQQWEVVLDTTKVQIFKQITTSCHDREYQRQLFQIPQRYRFSSKSQHLSSTSQLYQVVLDTTKVQIFKQITTHTLNHRRSVQLFQIPQRYRFSSKSQLFSLKHIKGCCCFRYHKGTDFQANHNTSRYLILWILVVLDTTKVQIFKQITTRGSARKM